MTREFKILIAYENAEGGLRAQQMVERLAAGVLPEVRIDASAWKFEALGRPQVRLQAGAAASEADMIIISTPGAHELPHGVRQWMQDWAPRKDGAAAALVAVFEEDKWSGASPAVRDYLSEMAERASMDFFCQSGDRRTNGISPAVRAWHRQDVNAEEHASEREWGINE